MSSTALSSYVVDFLWSLTACFNCFPSNPALKINGRSYKILRLLGEGGFSYVYLVQSPPSPNLHALKKIRCPFGQESVALALKEVEAYSLFTPHPNIIHAIDHAVVSDRADASAKTVYILLPYFRRGNLQDAINANLVNGGRFPERRLMVLFRGVCEALKAMHGYRVGGGPGGKKSQKRARRVRQEAARADRDAEEEAEGLTATAGKKRARRGGGGQQHAEETGDADEMAEPLMEGEVSMAQDGVAEGDIRAYAHRDIKPGNIMIADNGTTPILMDLGSLCPSPTPITSRAHALQIQDQAAEHSTMPYRAPELFDVKTDTVIDTAVDIWSLGCTLYACLVGKSPFEARSEETGGSLSLCVLGGDWRFPDEGPEQKSRGKQKVVVSAAAAGDGAERKAEYVVSEGVKDVVRRCLKVEPGERPGVEELIGIVEAVIAALPEDGDPLDG